jgi:gliding motility-associated-like protein
MLLRKQLFLILSFCLVFLEPEAQTVDFTAPSSICAGRSFNIINNTTGASTYKWNFCSKDLNQSPAVQNLGGFGMLDQPMYIDIVFTNNNYYGFITNFSSGDLIRLNFGNSLKNNPTAVNLGNVNGVIPSGGNGGIQVVQNKGNWYAIIVAGYPPGGINPRIIKIEFGPNIANPNPTGQDWGNLGNMYDPNDLILVQEGTEWIGITVSGEPNTITRFNFGSSFDNPPVGNNLGNIGNLAEPAGLYLTHDQGDVIVFVTNSGDKTRIGGRYTITRLNFGSSINNFPSPVNIGNVGNQLQHPRDMVIASFCNQTLGYVLNAHPFYNSLLKVDFNNDITTSFPTPAELSHQAFDYPHAITNFFSEGNDLIAFIVNRNNSTISRIMFADCNNASLPNSTVQNPPPISYDQPGIYNIRLTVDEGMASEKSLCKQVVVTSCIDTVIITNDTTICAGGPLQISSRPAISYKWTPVAFLDDPTSATPVTTTTQDIKYYVDVVMMDSSSELIKIRDSISIDVRDYPKFGASPMQTVCPGEPVTLTATGGDSYSWSPAALLTDRTSPSITFAPQTSGTYTVNISDNICHHDTTINVSLNVMPPPVIGVVKSNDINCTVHDAKLEASGGKTYSWSPAESLDNSTAARPIAFPDTTTTYIVTGKNEFGCKSTASVIVNVDKSGKPVFVVPNAFSPNNDGKNDCFGIQNWGNANIKQFSIYDRWGKLIFQSSNPSQCWDGTWKGQPQESGGYIYVIRAHTLCGEVTRKGLLTLIR